MKASILTKLETLVERYEEVQHLLGDPDVIGDQDKIPRLVKRVLSARGSNKVFPSLSASTGRPSRS